MAAQNSAGIQTLLDMKTRDIGSDLADSCEERRKEMLKRSFKRLENLIPEDRTKRVKEARDEAKKEIDAYKKAKNDEFKKFESEHTSGNKKAEEEANIEAEKKIAEIRVAGKNGQEKVISDLLNAVFEVKLVVSEKTEVPK